MIDVNHRRLRPGRALLLTAVALIGCLVTAVPAAAHDDAGVIEVSAAPAGRTVEYGVLVTYVGDGHPAQDATATAVAEQAGRDPVGPLVLEATAEPGRYRARVTFPADGTWTVRFSSLSPTAYLERTETITAAPAATTSAALAGNSTTTPPRAESSVATTRSAESPDALDGAASPAGDAARGTGGSGSTVFFVLLAVIAAGATWLIVSSKRRRTNAARS